MALVWGPRTSAKEACRHFADQIRGRNIIITGVSVGGLGFATAQAIAACEPGLLVITGRNPEKLDEAKRELLVEIADLSIELLILDLGDLDATKRAAEEVLSWDIPIDVLINNAGMVSLAPNPADAQTSPTLKYTSAADGHELHWQTNYLAPWLFTALLLPRITSSSGQRVVNLSSGAHLGGPIRWDDPNFTSGPYERAEAYGQSKTANILHARALAKRSVMAFSLHPGGIYTPLLQAMPQDERIKLGKLHGVFHEDGSINPDCPMWKTPDEGAATTCRAAFDPSLEGSNGAYLMDCALAEDKCAEHAKESIDQSSVERLWQMTNDALRTSFP